MTSSTLFKKDKYCAFGKMLVDVAVANNCRSQSELATKVRSNKTHIHSILTGKVDPSAKFMKKVKLGMKIKKEDWDSLYAEALRLGGWKELT